GQNPQPPVHERETRTSRVKHNPPATPLKAQDMLHRPTHPTAKRSPGPARGQSHRRKHCKKATTARQGLGTPPTPHPNPRGAPACWPPTFPHGTPRSKEIQAIPEESQNTTPST
ncbi:hypothetical protein ILYODFUR_028067, partial [Ilyodon furcidens]